MSYVEALIWWLVGKTILNITTGPRLAITTAALPQALGQTLADLVVIYAFCLVIALARDAYKASRGHK